MGHFGQVCKKVSDLAGVITLNSLNYNIFTKYYPYRSNIILQTWPASYDCQLPSHRYIKTPEGGRILPPSDIG
jgi:hypothetical protein